MWWHTVLQLKGKLANGVGNPVLFTLPRNMVYPALLLLLPLIRTSQLPAFDWTESPADLNGLVLFAERRNLVSARVPSHFKRNLPTKSLVRHWYSSALPTGLQDFPVLFLYIFIRLSDITKWLGLRHIFRLPATNIILITTDLIVRFYVCPRALHLNGYTVPSNGKITPPSSFLTTHSWTFSHVVVCA